MKALEHYPFKTKERELITLDKSQDFEYVGIFYNLVKNALEAIKEADKGEITIGLELGERFNKVIFRDAAVGVKQEFLPYMFDLFESQKTTKGGTGIGLAFCKIIMTDYGGDITCNSIEEEYTEFLLSFPVVNSN